MRLLETCPTFGVGGIARHAIDLSLWLRQRGHHVSMAGTPGPWIDEGQDADFLSLDTHKVTGEGGSAAARIAAAVNCAGQLRRFLRDRRIQLIHAHESAAAIVARLASFGMNIPMVLTYHGSEEERVASFGRIGRITADRIITPSHRTSDNLHERAGVPRSKLQVIGLGVKPSPVYQSAEIAACRKQLLGDDGNFLVVSVARLAHQKGIDILIDVARQVTERQPGARFVVVGGGPLDGQVQKWAKEANMDGVVTFIGESDKPHLYLKASDLFMLSSRWEALPITIVEAFRAGCPVVATDAGGVRELVDSAVGRVVPIGDPDPLAQAVLEIYGDEQLRHSMSQAALERSTEDRFIPEYINRQFECMYAEILGETLGAELTAASS